MAGINSYGVPIDLNAIPGNINSYIAQGPNYSWIGNLPDSYFAGQQAGYQERNRNAFPNGIPRDDQGNIDWQAVSDTLAKAGGTAAAPAAISTAQYPQLMKAVNDANGPVSAAPAAAPQSPGVQPTGNLPPSTAGGAQPIRTTDQAVTPSQIASANGGTQATPRQIAQNTGGDAVAIASALGVGVDQPVDMSDANNRQTVINAVRGNGGQQPQAEPQQTAQAQPQQQPQGQPAPASADVAQRYEQAAQAAYAKASAMALINPNVAKMLQARGDEYAKAAEQYRGGAIANQTLTPEQKNASTPGPISDLERSKAGASGLATDDAKNFSTDANGIVQLGRNAANGAQKAQFAKNLTLQPTFYSGPFSEGTETYNQFKSIFGSNPSAALPQEAFNKAVNDILQEQIRAMGKSGVGRVLQAEVNIMRQSIASLGMTPASNRALLTILGRVYQQEQDLGGIATNIQRQAAAGRIPAGQYSAALNDAVNKYYQDPSHHLITQDEIQHPQLLAAPDAPPQSAQWSLQQKQAWAASVGLKSGDPVRMNGNIVAVP